ncbi:ATP-binding protein [Lyngbya aestuarii]|uniref:ATP-binding protein n=1 Tax=Lyngbya aestuarii TaxID=118322 RepID=UPI00403E022E
MAKPGQSSFRRILLSRLLLLSVPVLLTGVYVTYKKARSAFLDTARQNLMESAQRNGESIQASIAALQANLMSASQSVVLQSQSPEAYQQFINQLAQQLPTQIKCAQLSNVQTKEIIANTCGDSLLANTEVSWSQEQPTQSFWNPSQVKVRVIAPEESLPLSSKSANQTNSNNQLNLLLSVPVYNQAGQLQYALSIESTLLKGELQESKPGSLSGYPVVINEEGRILVHRDPERVGSNIAQEGDAAPLEELVEKAQPGQQDFLHLFSFEENTVELIAGYTAIPSPITAKDNQKWIILAATPLDNALAGLENIKRVLYTLGFGLIAANFLATLYLARDLARPLEKLRDYALNESQLHSTDRIPHDFKVREINQLSEALDGMIERLRDWAEELETAWKEAQTANQLKNQFLASTSHELRTPLNGIIGCLRLVKDGFCDSRDEELDFLQRADDAAIHLLGIINDVLDIAKIEAGKLSVETEPVDLRKLLDEVINLQAVPIQQKGIQFNTNDLHEVIAVRADPAKLKQVLLNVVDNAVKFTDTGSITISTIIESINHTTQSNQPSTLPSSYKEEKSQETDVDGKDSEVCTPVTSSEGATKDSIPVPSSAKNSLSTSLQVVITVKDTGIGIDPNQQHKLFRPFVMVDGSTTRRYGGTGLGLAISRNLIQLMGGAITLSSNGRGKGTTVEIKLPTIEPSLLVSGESPKLTSMSQISADELSVDGSQVS